MHMSLPTAPDPAVEASIPLSVSGQASLMSHPVFGETRRIQVLSLSVETTAEMHPLFAESHDAVVAKFEAQRAKRSRVKT